MVASQKITRIKFKSQCDEIKIITFHTTSMLERHIQVKTNRKEDKKRESERASILLIRTQGLIEVNHTIN